MKYNGEGIKAGTENDYIYLSGSYADYNTNILYANGDGTVFMVCAKQIKEKAEYRQLISLGEQLIENARTGLQSPLEIIDETTINEFFQQLQNKKIIKSFQWTKKANKFYSVTFLY